MPSYAIEPFIIRYHFSLSTPCHKQNRIGFCYAFLCYRAVLKQVSLSLFWYAVTSKAAFSWRNIWLIVSKRKVPIIDLNVGSGGKKTQNHSYKYLDKHLFFPFLSLNFSCFLQMVLSPSEFTQRGGGGIGSWDALSSGFPMFYAPWFLSAGWCFTDFWHSMCNCVCNSCLCSRASHPWAAGPSGMYLPHFGMKATPRAHIPVFLHIAWAGHHLLFWLGIL